MISSKQLFDMCLEEYVEKKDIRRVFELYVRSIIKPFNGSEEFKERAMKELVKLLKEHQENN